MKVLVVDDQSVILDMVIEILRRYYEDFTFLRATNGREACKVASAELPTIIIMDWEMPEMTGIEALQRIKKNATTSKIHVIISSSFSSSSNVSMALENGAIDYIRKPIDEIELVARVRSVLMLHTAIEHLNTAKDIAEKGRSSYEKLIKSIIPPQIMQEYEDNDGSFVPRRYKNTTVMFIDLVDFTRKTNTLSSGALIQELTALFSSFDRIFKNFDCVRIKTIGDAYLAVSGIGNDTPENVLKAIKACQEVRDYIDQRNSTVDLKKEKWAIRIGLATGSVVGAILSEVNCRFDIFGDTVNLASRIQHLGNPNEIWCCAKTAEIAKDHFPMESMGSFDVKGKGELHLFRVKEARSSQELQDERDKGGSKIINKYKLKESKK
ncbi:MAG: response regulator [Breznakibacter sp.]|nr:response regulator [Breznakibacter sp.]